MRIGDSLCGFRVLSLRDLPEYRSTAAHLRHEETGCEVLHLGSADAENLFAFCFTTPPVDETGVTHIAEHCALSGSRKFPLKEPFSVLMKGSMHTFMNAFTFPDRTVYPASSRNRTDFFNLMLVYGDAVFFPLFRKETFMQEAWRFEAGEAGLRYSGIVYNEMKGSYSSPESVVGDWAYRSLFPDTPYRFDSGGDPKYIPDLSVKDLRGYHRRFYHPSNCRIFLHGDIPLEEELSFLQKNFLGEFGKGRAADPLALQKRWETPRRVEKTYPIRPDSPTGRRTSICLSWLTVPVTDPLRLLAMEMLTEILIGSAGSPLQKKLVDSGLGEDVSPASGLETELRETVLCVGLRGTEPEREDDVRQLILETMESLARNGVELTLVDSVINRVEFRNREIRGGGSPYALRLMRRALRGWVHGLDPVDSLVFTPVMEEVKLRLNAEKGFFEEYIRTELLSNSHRVTLVVKPDPVQEVNDSRELSVRLEGISAGLDAKRKKRIVTDQKAFTAYQRRVESDEETAVVPSLTVGDLPRRVEIIPSVRASVLAAPLFMHDIFTNGIAYIDVFFPLDSLVPGLSRFMPLFCRAVCGSGAPGISYGEMAIELFRLTGGFYSSLDASGIVGNPSRIGSHVFFRLKALWKNLGPALDLAGALIGKADFGDTARLRDLVLELRNDQKSALIASGHHFAALRAAKRICVSARYEEEWKGIEQVVFLEELAAHIDARMGEVQAALEGIRAAIISQSTAVLNATVPEEYFPALAAPLERFLRMFPETPPAAAPNGTVDHGREAGAAVAAESLVTSATVGYVARAIEGFRYEDPASAMQTVLSQLMSSGYLWEKVRMEGGAYGVFSFARNMDGVFIFTSYRDPNIVRTLQAYREALEGIADGGVDGKSIERAVIGTVGKEERPMDPGEKGFVSIQRHLYGITDAMRQERRALVLAADSDALKRTAGTLLQGFDRGFSVVVAGRKAIEEAGREKPELLSAVIELPE